MTSLLANAGTPYLWGSFMMLVIGNGLIGCFEASLLRRRYGIENPHLPLWLVLANYATAGLGYLVLPWYLGVWEELAKLVRFHFEIAVVVLAWIVTFVATAILEWWVVHRAAERKMAAGKSLRASFYMNAISYACLLPLAIWMSDWSGPRNLKSRTVTYKMDRPLPKGYILFVSPDHRRIQKIRFDRTKSEVLVVGVKADLSDTFDSAVGMAISPTGRRHLKYIDWPIEEAPTLILDFDPKGITEKLLANSGWQYPLLNPYIIRRFESADSTEFDVSAGYWPGYDFRVANQRDNSVYDLSFQTPFLVWRWSNQTLLPDGWCVAEMDGGIYLIDLRNRQIGLIERGHGAMVVLDD